MKERRLGRAHEEGGLEDWEANETQRTIMEFEDCLENSRGWET